MRNGKIISHYPNFDRHQRVVRRRGERIEEGKKGEVRTRCEISLTSLTWERTKRRRKESRRKDNVYMIMASWESSACMFFNVHFKKHTQIKSLHRFSVFTVMYF